MRRLRHVVSWVTAIGFWSLTTHADPAAEARFHDELARQHYDARRFEAALREFFLEQRAAQNPRIIFNIALCFQQLERPEQEFHFFTEYAASGDSDPERRAYAEKTLAELAQRVARVFVTSEPAGAAIFVDRREHGSYGTTPRVLALSPGEHRIWIDAEGYETGESTVSVAKGRLVGLPLALTRVVGEIDVDSSVAGDAEVRSAEGQSIAHGPTPFVAAIPPGGYEIRVVAPGFLTWSTLASVHAKQTTAVVAAPAAIPKPTSDLTVTANVSGSLVELDEEPAGFAPTVITNVPVGAHRVRVKGARLLPWNGTVSVGPDERAWVTVSLEAPPTVHRSAATWVVGGLAGAMLGAAGVLGIMAGSTHSEFESADPSSDRSALRDRGIALNTASTVLLVSGLVAAGTAVALYFLTSETRGRPSSASVERQRR
jgi:outer membrane receptor for ferrienterochelin and colicins